jgi:hypothetical protein
MDEPGGGPASLAQLCQGLQRAADADRRRLARTLHDSASQTLSAAAMSLSLLEGEGGLSAAGKRALAQAQVLVAACCKELQEISQQLHPPLLAEAGLGPALAALARRLGPGRLVLEHAPLPRLPPLTELNAFRFVEEALGLYLPDSPVRGRIFHDGEVAIALEGALPPGANGGVIRLALRQRVRAASGRLRERRAAAHLSLEVRFPTPSNR